MTTTEPAKPTTGPNLATKGDTAAKPTSANLQAEMVTLDQLAREMKMPPRDARMLLRLAAKQTRQYGAVCREDWLRMLAHHNRLPLVRVQQLAVELGQREYFGELVRMCECSGSIV